ncbi:SAGA-associated factor 11-like isoform X2 [Phragmites australis]|uniref:SAGA-associated factor 11-like isoform X2 n=1 Tax=Phragmites australis TaxID=29695 RepID=UPI002D76D9E7|nr:SAGA-associated factor 11-like isoform X2 [Phragmites australis]
MSSSKDAPLSPRSQLALSCFEELLDCAVADVASECHRIARLGLDRSVDTEEEELCVWAERAAAAAAGDLHPGSGSGGGGEEGGGSKGGVDVFGQTHPAIAADVVECMNCGRHVVAGRFAPHLEKCMGKRRLELGFFLESNGLCLLSCVLCADLSDVHMLGSLFPSWIWCSLELHCPVR